MTDQAATVSKAKGWLVCRSGPLAGTRYQLSDGTTRVGRSPENDIVVQGSNAATVSGQHMEIVKDGERWHVRDSESTNGTYLNGEKVADAELSASSVIQLGTEGPEFTFLLEEPAPAGLDRTLIIAEGAAAAARAAPEPEPAPDRHEAMLTAAVARARLARIEGLGGQTMTIMREMVNHALRQSTRRHRLVIYSLAAALVVLSSFGYWKIAHLKAEKKTIDQRIQEIETRLQTINGSPAQMDQLVTQLDTYQGEAESLEHNLLYRLGGAGREDFVTHEIRVLMAEFGAEVYSIPPEFSERVKAHIQQYQGPDRPLIERALHEAEPRVRVMQEILKEEKLPGDFAYVPLVEAALNTHQSSGAGAAGPWQFTPATARACGLRVEGGVDERYNLQKSTHAACKYLRQLILDFGSGSSVMLALAAYDLGPSKVKQAVMHSVEDPIKQRNFWYLYRVRALPKETREYVPKVIAAIIIGRNPEKFGF